jgi:hypothetical protein
MTQRNYSETGWPDFVPLPTYLPIGEAKRSAWRAFWRGIVIGGLMTGAAFIGGAAWGGDTADFGGTGCQLVPVSGQAHVAEMRCHNVHTSGQSRDEAAVDAGGITVVLRVFHGPGDSPDSFIALPPDGYFAEPPVLTLNEWQSGVIRILPFVGA